jgi:hypothetical protein
MLRKLSDRSTSSHPFKQGQEIFLVTRKGEILSGFAVAKVLIDLVSLDRAPFPDSDKQGFTIDARLLRPNWCAGRKALLAGCSTLEEAKALAAKRKPGGDR